MYIVYMHVYTCTCILDTCTCIYTCNTCIIILVEAAECSQYAVIAHARPQCLAVIRIYW